MLLCTKLNRASFVLFCLYYHLSAVVWRQQLNISAQLNASSSRVVVPGGNFKRKSSHLSSFTLINDQRQQNSPPLLQCGRHIGPA